MKEKSRMSTRTMVLAAIMAALVFLLQWMGAFVKIGPFAISLVTIPIVIGGAECGKGVGAWLGLVFGAAVLLSGDAALFLAVNPVGTFITVLLKGILCGFAAAAVYEIVKKFNKYVAVVVAAFTCPVVNTGVFLLGCLAFFMDAVTEWATAAGLGGNVGQYMIVGLVGINFLVELASTIILSPVVVRLLNIKNK
ncbi:MAG: ECF transporter S component [Clostridia bacterium]|nr:ECF transporter S component [Clostridia bacterium]